MRQPVILRAACNRPTISAALASLATIATYVTLNVALLRDLGVDPMDVGAALICEVIDDSNGTAAVIGSAYTSTNIKAGDSVGSEWGVKITLSSHITAAGTYHTRFRWRLASNVRNAAGVVVLQATDIAAQSAASFIVAS